MTPSTMHEMRYARRFGSALALLLATAYACAPAVPTSVPTPTVDGLPAAEPEVRVGLSVDVSGAVIGHEGGVVIANADDRRVVAHVSSNGLWDTRADQRGVWLVSATDQPTLGPFPGLILTPEEGGVLSVDGRPYRGVITLLPTRDGRLTVVNRVGMEAYLLGVVPRELGPVGEELLEAAKAQAVAARTYAVARLGGREALGFDVYATIYDQVYGGLDDEHEPVSRAVRETHGEVLLHDGAPIEAYYHSTCAGHTAAIEEVWDEAPRPYLKAVRDVNPETGEAYDHFSNRFRWTERWTALEMETILAETLADSLPDGTNGIGRLLDMQVLASTPSGRIREMRIDTEAGSARIGGDRIRWILHPADAPILNSARFDVTLLRDDAGAVTDVVAEGSGWGHGIGMCQVGAMGRARDAGQSYRTILETYYAGTDLRDLY